MRTIVALAPLAALCTPGVPFVAAEDESAPRAIRPSVVLTGSDSHIQKRGYHRVESKKEWIKLWRQHKGDKGTAEYDRDFNPLGLPRIEFDQVMVIAIFQGSGWNSAGLEAVEVREQQDHVLFRFDDKSYQTAGPDGGGRQVTVYGFFVLPRSPKPVVLEENVQSLLGEPPVWREQARLPGAQAAAREERPAMKGRELYSWQDEKNQWRFSLVLGTNRLKTVDEVQAKPLDLAQLKKELSQLAKGEYVFWMVSSRRQTSEGQWQQVPMPFPPQEMSKEIGELSRKLELKLSGPGAE